MAGRTSAGILLYRYGSGGLQVLVAHMGGPFWARKDVGAWSLVKGEYEPPETALAAAGREFREETGHDLPAGEPVPLGEVRQSGGKVVIAWAVEGDLDPADLVPGEMELEWPPRSGRTQRFPEIDRVAWLAPEQARRVLVTAQRAFVDRLEQALPGT